MMIEEPRRRGLRKTWFQIHKWVGIVLAIIFIPLSATGSLLVWDKPLDRLLNPLHYQASAPAALPASAYVAAAAKALPEGKRIATLKIGNGPVVVTANDPPSPQPRRGPPARTSVWLDPGTGQILDVGPAASVVLRWIHVFHGSLQIPGAGRTIVGWLGVAMLASCITGLWLWWPITGRWMRGLRWKRRAQLEDNLHHQAGFWIVLPLGIRSLTGILISFPSLTGGNARVGERARRVAAVPLASPRLSVDQVLTAAGPAARAPITLTWPTDREPAWRVASGEGERSRTVTVDDTSGVAAALRDKERARSKSWSRRIHDGDGLGLVWQTIIFIAGWAPALLGITGIIMWLRSRRWRDDVNRRLRSKQAEPAAS
jgi:uncharacterized iron-regulated membrane protein